MPERPRRGLPWPGPAGVRVRVTLAAAAITALTVLGVSTWLVSTVEDTLTRDLREAAGARLERLQADIEAGVEPTRLTLLPTAEGEVVQVVQDGDVVASTPRPAEGAGSVAVGTGPDGRPVVVGAPARSVLVTTATAAAEDGAVELVALSSLDSVRQGAAAVRDGMVVVGPMLVGAVAVMAWLLAGRALRPVESIRAEVEAITGSTLDRRVPEPGTGDEVARLARTMNAMLARLEEASARQQRFVADASHELRSPVAAIRTQLEVALRTAGRDDDRPAGATMADLGDRGRGTDRAKDAPGATDPTAAPGTVEAPGGNAGTGGRTGTDWPAVAATVLAEEARLEATIEDLLALAQLDGRTGPPAAAPVDLAALAADEVHRATARGDGRVEVTLDAPGPVVVPGARVQLRRALANLVENATRHAHRRVQVSVRARDGRARVLVDDDGPGIPEHERDRVFERFARLEQSRARAGIEAGGAGLGLSLVRRIAERHGGTVHVADAPLGGARLVLDLPLTPR